MGAKGRKHGLGKSPDEIGQAERPGLQQFDNRLNNFARDDAAGGIYTFSCPNRSQQATVCPKLRFIIGVFTPVKFKVFSPLFTPGSTHPPALN